MCSSSGSGYGGGVGAFTQSEQGRKFVSKFTGGNKDRQRLALASGAGLDPGGTSIGAVVNPRAREKFSDKAEEFFKGKEVDPPAASPAPAPKQSVSDAQRIARDRQRRRAIASKGRGSTVRTGSLGVSTRANTTRKTLLGE
jgi:hypothetical protein